MFLLLSANHFVVGVLTKLIYKIKGNKNMTVLLVKYPLYSKIRLDNNDNIHCLGL